MLAIPCLTFTCLPIHVPTCPMKTRFRIEWKNKNCIASKTYSYVRYFDWPIESRGRDTRTLLHRYRSCFFVFNKRPRGRFKTLSCSLVCLLVVSCHRKAAIVLLDCFGVDLFVIVIGERRLLDYEYIKWTHAVDKLNLLQVIRTKQS